MSGPDELVDQEIVDLAMSFRDLRWSWDPAEIGELAKRFGWTVEFEYKGSAQLDTGLGMASGDIHCDASGKVAKIAVALCSYIDDTSPSERWYLHDRFVHAVELVTRALAEPTDRLPKEVPEVWWRGVESTVGLARSSTVARIFLASNAHLDKLARGEM